MLRFENLYFRWPNTIQDTLTQLSIKITAGEQVALVGDNGAGKSTLLRLAAGLLQPRQGQIQLNGDLISKLSATQRATQIGILFQEVEKQVFHSSVKQEIAFGLKRLKISKQEMNQRIADALEICYLEDVADYHPLDLNAGQKRMVAVACLSAVRPKILLLDEPSRDFDTLWLTRFENWLAVQKDTGCAVLAISHDLDFVARNFQRVLHLSAGKLIADGSPEKILCHADLQPDSLLPAPTLYSLSHALNIQLENTPEHWANNFARLNQPDQR